MSSGHGFMLDLEHDVPVESLKIISIPTLMLHSKKDNAVPFEHALHAYEHIKDAKLMETQSWVHLIWLGKSSQEVVQKVSAFLSKPRP